MILVTGATGTVGSATLRALTADGRPARALLHDPGKADRLPAGVEPVTGTLQDPPSGIFDGVDAVLLVSPASAGQAEVENAFVDALARAGRATHLVKIVAAGIEQRPAPVRFNDQHQQVLDHIGSTGLPLTVLAPNGFMENLLFSAGTVRSEGAVYTTVGDGAVSFIAADDIGAVAAHVLTDPAPHAGATYTLTGPEALTYDRIAEVLTPLAGRPVSHIGISPDQARAGMLAAGMPEWNVDALIELEALYRAGQAAAVTDEVTKATGRPARTLTTWADQHADSFRP
jgi:uncharacterized protein YbjT (DUF2867 family)